MSVVLCGMWRGSSGCLSVCTVYGVDPAALSRTSYRDAAPIHGGPAGAWCFRNGRSFDFESCRTLGPQTGGILNYLWSLLHKRPSTEESRAHL